MISRASMTMLQEQTWLRNMSIISGLHRRVNEIFLLACLGIVSIEQTLKEFILINLEIDRCMEELKNVGICTDEDLDRMGWARGPQEIAEELGVTVEQVQAAFTKLFEEGKIER